MRSGTKERSHKEVIRMDAPVKTGAAARRRPICIAAVICLALIPISADGHDWGSRSSDWMSNFGKLDSPTKPHRFEPLLGVEIGGISLQRSHPDAFDLVATDGTMGPAETIATSDVVKPDIKTGWRFAATMYNLTDHVPGLDIDFVYFDVRGVLANKSVNATGYNTTDVIPTFYGGIPAAPVPDYTLISESDLDSFELLVGYRPYARVRMTLGLRWLNVKETFDVLDTAQLPDTVSGFYSDGNNEAFGWQIGGDVVFWSGKYVRVYGKAKYAGMNNDVGGNAIAENVQFVYSGDVDTSLVDLEFGLHVPMGDWASFKVAYQGLFLDDAVGAVEQSNEQSFFDPLLQVPQYHDIEWHGFQFGFSLLW